LAARQITREQARQFLLVYQGLGLSRPASGKAAVLKHFERVGSIQYDPLNLVGPNPYLVLQSRIHGFKQQLLDELLYVDRVLVDGWDKNMCIYSAGDWPYFRRYRERAREHYGERVAAALPSIRAEIQNRGPLDSDDLDHDEKVDWPWGPTRTARAALEGMYFWGELIVHSRTGSRKSYDFAHKYLPASLLDTPEPHAEDPEYFAWHVKRRIGAVGLLWNKPGDAWLGIRGLLTAQRNAAIELLRKRGDITQVAVSGLAPEFFVRTEDVPLLLEVTSGRAEQPQRAEFIAPLDNLIWDRKLIEALFDFKYTWEVYKPAEQRQYGYYVLPVLMGDRFIGRIEPRYSKKTGRLSVLGWWPEPGFLPDAAGRKQLRDCFARFAGYLGASGVDIEPGTGRLSGCVSSILLR
jgi:uncharacterized protein